MIDVIRNNLRIHRPIPPAAQYVERSKAAVLVPLIADPSAPRVMLTERAGSLSSHGGEVSFPGGKVDTKDPSLTFTALRENKEELGISPDDVEIIGSLRPFVSKYGLLVTPFVGVIAPNIRLQPNPDEIASVFEVPLSFFATAVPIRTDDFFRYGENYRVPAYVFEGYEIWGLTAMILAEFLKVGVCK